MTFVSVLVLQLPFMPHTVHGHARTVKERRHEVEENRHAERRHVNHGNEVAQEARDCSGHVDKVVVGGAFLAFLEEPRLCALKNLVADAAEKHVHAHAQHPEDEHIERRFGIDEVKHARRHLHEEERQHERKEPLVPL